MSVFNGKVCVVTGAASGIGRALAIRLAGQGALLALSDVNAAGLEETKNMVGVKANHVRSDRLDVADADAVAAYPDLVREQFGAADYVFNVAGLTRFGVFAETSLSAFEEIMNVNFWGVVRLSKAFLPQLQETRGGLVNISSLFGLIGFPGQSHYCASKFAVCGFSEAIAIELEGAGIAVTSVHPGGVATDIARNAKVDALIDKFNDRRALEAEFDKAAITSPQKAADIILKGAAKRKRRVIVGRDAQIMSLLQRLAPQNYYRLIGLFSKFEDGGNKLRLSK